MELAIALVLFASLLVTWIILPGGAIESIETTTEAMPFVPSQQM
jgi:hypothetical protein